MIRSAALPVSRWPNGAGRKADIAIGDGWSVGIAWVDEDAPFSELAGLDRTITLVDGPGFALAVAGQADLVVAEPFRPTRFDGGSAPRCRIAGRCRVMNVMTARDRYSHTVTVTPAPALIEPRAAWAVLLRGAATVTRLEGPANTSFTLSVLDAIQVDMPTEVTGDANALVAVIAIVPAAA